MINDNVYEIPWIKIVTELPVCIHPYYFDDDDDSNKSLPLLTTFRRFSAPGDFIPPRSIRDAVIPPLLSISSPVPPPSISTSSSSFSRLLYRSIPAPDASTSLGSRSNECVMIKKLDMEMKNSVGTKHFHITTRVVIVNRK